MGVIVGTKQQVEEYFNSNARSQSKLKLLIKGLDSFLNDQQKEEKELYYDEKGHFIIGSAVDLLLTGQKERYDEEYYISDLDVKPSAVEMSIINRVFDDVVESYSPVQTSQPGFEYGKLHQYPGSIQLAVDEELWQMRWKPETRIDKIIEVGSMYFEDLKKSHGKQILSKEQELIINGIVMSLTTNIRTKDYFDRESQSRNTQVDFYYQLPIYFTYRGEECKALLDMVIVVKDENNKILSVEPIDLKTMFGNTLDFLTSLKTRRYDIQAGWYHLALMNWLGEMGAENVIIKPFKFIVESNSFPGNPLIYILDETLLEIGANGRPELNVVAFSSSTEDKAMYPLKYKEIKGYNQLIDDYEWFEENNWKEEKVVKRNEGVLKIDWNGIIN